MNIKIYKVSLSRLLVSVFILLAGFTPITSRAITDNIPNKEAQRLVSSEITSPTMFYDQQGVAYFNQDTQRPGQILFSKSNGLVQFSATTELNAPTLDGSIIDVLWPSAGNSYIVKSYEDSYVFNIYISEQGTYFKLPSTVSGVAWLPGGTEILYLEQSGQSVLTLYRASLTNTNKTVITTFNSFSYYPTLIVSPNGQTAFVKYTDDQTLNTTTQLVNINAKTKTPVVNGDDWTDVLWSPDGNRFAYAQYVDDNSDFLLDTYIYTVATGAKQKISVDKISIPLAWSHDGQYLYLDAASDLTGDVSVYITKVNSTSGAKVGTDFRATYQGQQLAAWPSGTVLNSDETLMFFKSDDQAFYVLALDGSSIQVNSQTSYPTTPGLQYPSTDPVYPTQVIFPANVKEGEVLKFYDPKTRVQQPTIYLVKLDGLHPFDSLESYNTYLESSNQKLKLLPGSVLEYTRVDSIPASEYQLGIGNYSNGELVNYGGTVFLIMNGEAIPFANKQAFEGLGYNFKNVSVGTAKSYLRTGGIFTSEVPHPWGSWVKDGNTVYYVDEAGLIGVPGMDIFYANNGKDQFILPANNYDRQIRERSTLLPVLTYADPRLPEFDTRSQASKNATRLSDVRQLASALELHYNDYGYYPYSLSELTPSYIGTLPTAPWGDGICYGNSNNYTYYYQNYGAQYQLIFCLTEATGGYYMGSHILSESGIQ